MKAPAIGGLLLVLGLSACGGPSLQEVALTEPEFNLETYFSGPLTAHGVVRDRSGRQTRSFTMTLHGKWQQGEGVLDETLTFNDGETSRRAWKIRRDGDNRWRATAEDVVGEAIFQATGNTLRLDYVLTVPYKKSTINVKVEDWLYLQPEGLVINQSVLKKWGLRVGDILTVIRRDQKE